MIYLSKWNRKQGEVTFTCNRERAHLDMHLCDGTVSDSALSTPHACKRCSSHQRVKRPPLPSIPWPAFSQEAPAFMSNNARKWVMDPEIESIMVHYCDFPSFSVKILTEPPKVVPEMFGDENLDLWRRKCPLSDTKLLRQCSEICFSLFLMDFRKKTILMEVRVEFVICKGLPEQFASKCYLFARQDLVWMNFVTWNSL